jgi:hypothetical protein
MSRITIIAAMGNAPDKNIDAATLTNLGTCDTNRVNVKMPSGANAVTIESFGTGDQNMLVTKRLVFDGGMIIKHLPPHMNMKAGGSADLTTTSGDVGIFTADEHSNWTCEEWTQLEWTQEFRASATVTIPGGWSKAMFRLVSCGTSPGIGALPQPGAGVAGSYLEKLHVGLAAGMNFTLTISNASQGYTGIASGNQPGGFVFPGSSFNASGYPLSSYLYAPAGGGFGTPQMPTGGDVNEPTVIGTYVAGVRAYTPGLVRPHPFKDGPLSPPQEVLAGQSPLAKPGLPEGGAAVVLDTSGGQTPGAGGVCWITWMK